MVVSNIKLLWAIQKNNIKNSFSSKADAFLNFSMMFANNFIFIFLWWALIENKGDINGWNFNHILILNAVNCMAYGTYAVFFRGAETISEYIENGNMDSYISSPRNTLLMVTTSESTFANWGDLATGFLFFFMTPYASFGNFLLFLLVSCFAFLVIISLRLILSTFSFFQDGLDKLSNSIFMSLMIFSSQPASIFSGWYKLILLTIIPAGFISLVPVNILTDFKIMDFIVMTVFSILFFAFAIWFFLLWFEKICFRK